MLACQEAKFLHCYTYVCVCTDIGDNLSPNSATNLVLHFLMLLRDVHRLHLVNCYRYKHLQ